jgi:hypothetical protein
MFNALLTHCKKIRLFYFSARQKNSSWDGMTHSFFRRQRSSYLFQYWCSQKNTWVPYLPFPWTIGPMVDLVDGHFFVNLPSHQSLYHIYYIVKRQTKKKNDKINVRAVTIKHNQTFHYFPEQPNRTATKPTKEELEYSKVRVIKVRNKMHPRCNLLHLQAHACFFILFSYSLVMRTFWHICFGFVFAHARREKNVKWVS